MKYLKLFEGKPYYIPYSDYLINDNIKSELKVRGFVQYYKLSNSVINIWRGMLQRYNVYPLKLNTNQMLYQTKDDCVIKLILTNDQITSMEKYKNTSPSLEKKVIYEGNYTWINFEKLYLGESVENKPI